MDGFEDGIEGLQHGGFFEGIFRRNFYDTGQDKGHDTDVFGIAAAGRLKPGGDACAFVGGALGKGAMTAEMTFHARNVMVEGDAVADFQDGL